MDSSCFFQHVDGNLGLPIVAWMYGVVQGLLGCADLLVLLIFADFLVAPSLGESPGTEWTRFAARLWIWVDTFRGKVNLRRSQYGCQFKMSNFTSKFTGFMQDISSKRNFRGFK